MNTKPFNAKSLYSLGFTRREDIDFEDDGNYFTGYEYKGVPVSFLNSSSDMDLIFLSFRADYTHMPYSEYSKLNTYKLTDKYNGVSTYNVDLEELRITAETIYQDFVKHNMIPEFANKSFAISGDAPKGFENRKTFIEKMKSEGWIFDKTLKPTTTYFVAGNGALDRKVKLAEKMNVKVVDML